MKKINSVTAVIITLILVACSKDDETPTPQTKTDFLTSGKWVVTSITVDDDGDGTYETDQFATFSSCFKDNYWTFKTNATVEINEGPTKCDPIDPQTIAGTWALTQNETHLMINADEWALQELTNSILKWKEGYSGGRSGLVTFTKQ